MERRQDLFMLIGRILLALIFLLSWIGKIGNFSGTTRYMASYGMSSITFFLVAAIIFELVGSISVITGYFTRFGVVLLLIFSIPATLIFNNVFVDPKMKVHFLKNVSIFGGLLILLSTGAGRYSLDYFLRRGKKKL